MIVGRRQMLRHMAAAAPTCGMLVPWAGAVQAAAHYLDRVDHLIYATPDLDRTVADIETLTGVRAAAGGSHPGRGTRNALLSLGARCYLEIMGPDPSQPEPAQPRTRGIDQLTTARLVGWAANGRDLPELVRRTAARGVSLGEPRPGSRRKPDGALLTWVFTDPNKILFDGLAPFLIDWGSTEHPSLAAPAGCWLRAFSLAHPDPTGLRRVLRALGLKVPVRSAAFPQMVAQIDTPKGPVVLG